MEKRIKIPILVTALIISLSQAIASHPVVETECGKVEGRVFQVTTDSGNKQNVHEFINIPYAAPPIGRLRWRAPVSLKDYGGCWNGTLGYNEKIIQCVQVPPGESSIQGDEDCLILNVRTPSRANKKNLPVVVWIHGGGMMNLHSRAIGYYPDNQFTASMEVVSVSINYRLNVFGFLSLEELWEEGENGGYGNYGIMDQILALRWVKNNIKFFGGNQNDVTIFGHSGGATGVYTLLSSSLGMSKGLFHKIIASSGAPNVHTTHVEANQMNRPFVSKTNCLKHSKEDRQTCLRGLDAKTVFLSSPMNGSTVCSNHLDYEFDFPSNVPTKGMPLQIIDPLVIKYSPTELLHHLKDLPYEHKIEILTGNMALDATAIECMNASSWSSWSALKKHLKPRVNSFNNCSYKKLLTLFRNRSPDKFTPSVVTPFYIYSLMTSDILLACATTQLAYNLTQYAPFKVYSYIVSQALSPVGKIPFYPTHLFDMVPLFNFVFLKSMMPFYAPTKADKALKRNLRFVFKEFIYSSTTFEKMHRNKTMEFWNSKVHTWDTPYHGRECKFLHENGFFTHSWGNRGIWNN